MTPPLFSPLGRTPSPPATPACVEGADGVRLRTARFPAERPCGSVILSSGRTEFIEKYAETIAELLARGFTVLTHDWRGQGLSGRLAADPLKGHARGVEPFLDDLSRVLAAHASALPRPWIAVGHSMGGGLTLAAVAEGRLRADAAVLSAPMLGVDTGGTPKWAARAAAFVLTRMGRGEAYAQAATDPLAERFVGNPLTHDRDRWERTRAMLSEHPELGLGQVTWGWLDFAFDLSVRLRRAAPGFPVPVSIVAAGGETLVDMAATRDFCARSPAARLEVVDGALHEILMETDDVRAVFWKRFDAVAADLR